MVSMGQHAIEVLCQEIDDEVGEYRIRVGNRVHYLTIDTHVFDRDTLRQPYLLVPQLPKFPTTSWSKMHITREDGALVTEVSTMPLKEVSFTWHDIRIDVLSLPYIERLRAGVFETMYEGRRAVAKIARFEWLIPRMTHETWAYQVLGHDENELSIAPKFLGHLTENGRVMGFLMEKVEGRPACIDDLERCEILLKRLHRLGNLGLVHGDLNRYNFIVEEEPDGRIWLVDFEHAQDFDEDLARAELESLASELAEETGRGGSVIISTN